MNLKLLFCGPVGAGKTTAVASLSDIPVVATEASATDATAAMKELTTVAMDYGQLRLDDATVVHLYGSPGQRRFDFMWEILAKGALGVIIVVSAAGADPLGDLGAFCDEFDGYIGDGRAAVGVTHGDEAGATATERLIGAARERLGFGPVFEIDAREDHDVRLLVSALLARLNPTA